MKPKQMNEDEVQVYNFDDKLEIMFITKVLMNGNIEASFKILKQDARFMASKTRTYMAYTPIQPDWLFGTCDFKIVSSTTAFPSLERNKAYSTDLIIFFLYSTDLEFDASKMFFMGVFKDREDYGFTLFRLRHALEFWSENWIGFIKEDY